MNTRRYDLGYQAAKGTHQGTLNRHGQPVELKGYGSTSPELHSDTYWYLRGWNAYVVESHDCPRYDPDGDFCEICDQAD